ncbi:hypothetical protein E2C01_082814 [Portunus trituberculatus]|uniref:Uncharacterized protein n=1 Tax=Portunus trituberculatus TaxID=210409 RepID=A0A5B7IVJ5_PORTR|nr:hypothetical protein [Portunus trituberculatus]
MFTFTLTYVICKTLALYIEEQFQLVVELYGKNQLENKRMFTESKAVFPNDRLGVKSQWYWKATLISPHCPSTPNHHQICTVDDIQTNSSTHLHKVRYISHSSQDTQRHLTQDHLASAKWRSLTYAIEASDQVVEDLMEYQGPVVAAMLLQMLFAVTLLLYYSIIYWTPFPLGQCANMVLQLLSVLCSADVLINQVRWGVIGVCVCVGVIDVCGGR